MANDKTSASKEKKKSGKGVNPAPKEIDFENGFVFDEDDCIGLLEGISQEDDFKFTINGVELEKKLLAPHMLTVNQMIPLFNGAQLELTSCSITIEEAEENGPKEAIGQGGRLIMAPKKAGFVVEAPIDQLLLRDDDTKDSSDLSVEGVLSSTFAFPFKNGYLFLANAGFFNDDMIASTAGGEVITDKGRVPADVVITEDGMAVGNKDKIGAALARKAAERRAAESESNAPEPVTDENTQSQEENKPTSENAPKDKEKKEGFKGFGVEKETDLLNSEEDEEENDGEEKNEDENEEDQGFLGEIKEKASDFVDKKKDQAKNYLEEKATGIIKESFEAARAGITIDDLLKDPASATGKFKTEFWNNFKQNVKKEAVNVKDDAIDELKALPGEVWDEVGDYAKEKEEAAAEKLEWAMAVISNAAAFLKIAKFFGINTQPIEDAVELVLKAMTNLEDTAGEKLEAIFPGGDEEKEEDDDKGGDEGGKRIKAEFKPIEGFSVYLFLEPAYRLSFGGRLKLLPGDVGDPIKVDVGVDAYGFASIKVGLGTEIGNDLMAVVGEVAGSAKLCGILSGGENKFATASLTNLQIGTIGENGLNFAPPTLDGAHMEMGAKLGVSLEALIESKSELFDWQKTLYYRKISATVADVFYEADAKKEGGKLFSAKGWHISNQSLTTSFLNQRKSKLLEMSLQEHNIGSTEDLLEQTEGQGKNLDDLDDRLTKLQDALDKTDNGKTLRATFPKAGTTKENSYADAAAGVLEGIKDDYGAVFINMQNTARTMQNEIEAFRNSPDYYDVKIATEEGVEKHESRATEMEEWANRNVGEDLSRENVLDKYRSIAAGGFKQTFGIRTGYEREDEQNSIKDAENQFYDKEHILAYEKEQIEKAAAKRQKHFDELMKLYDDIGKDPSKAEAFIKKYQSIVDDDPDGSLVDHMAEYGLSAGVFSDDDEAYEYLENYEKARFDDATEKLLTGFKDLYKLVDQLKEVNKQDEFNAKFTEVFAYLDDDMWATYVRENMDEADKENFYNKNAENSNEKNAVRVKLLQKLKENETKYNDSENQKERLTLIEESKTEFREKMENMKYYNFILAKLTSKNEWDDFMESKDQYKRMSAEDIRNYAKDYVTNEGFYDWEGSGELDSVGKDLYECYSIFKGDNVAAMSQVLKYNSNAVEAYNDYLSGAGDLKNVGSYLAVWKLPNILKFEIDKADHYKKKDEKNVDKQGHPIYSKNYFKHHERVSFLNEMINQIGIAGKSDEFYDADGATTETLEHYFNGTRPSSRRPYIYKEKGKEKELKIIEAKDYAGQYLKQIKAIRSPNDPDFRDRMSEALEHKMEAGKAARQKIADAVENLSEEDKNDARKVREAWEKAGGSVDFLNSRKAKEDFGFHEMISYLQFKIERKADDFDEKAFIEAAKSNGIEGKESLFTPVKLMEFAEKYRKRQNEKHSSRLDMIQEARADKKPYSETIEKYNEIERQDSSGKVEWAKKSIRSFFSMDHQSGYDKSLQENETLRKRITPDLILKFELNRISEGNLKHSGRYKAVEEAAEDKAREVYNKMNGGGAFYETIRKDVKEGAKELQHNRSGKDELERIKEYEHKKSEKYRKMKESAEKDMVELTAKRKEIADRMNASSAFISATAAKVDLLKNRPKNMDEYASIKDLSQPINAVKADAKNVSAQKKEVEALKQRIQAAGKEREKLLQDLKTEIAEEKEKDKLTGVK
ncbi:MAG: hypothetical protein K6F37_04385 [Lachnospiraceae bacterium]|nr:hypothetical protein [Lachnospiraceae bacterium]